MSLVRRSQTTDYRSATPPAELGAAGPRVNQRVRHSAVRPTIWYWALLVMTCPAVLEAQGPKSPAGAIEQYGVAAQYQKLEQFDLAAKEWEKLISDFPQDPLAAAGRHYAGVCQFQLGNYPAAVQWFGEFVSQHPQHELLEATLTNLGLATYNQAQAADEDQANELYQRAVEVFDKRRKEFPDGVMASEADFYRGEAIYALGKPADAATAYGKWLAAYPDSPLAPNVRLALGSTQSELGETDAAVATLTALIKSQPSAGIAAQALVRLGETYNAANKHRQAADSFAKALEDYAAEIDAEYVGRARASAIFGAGDFAKAANAYEQLGDLASAGKSYYQAGDYAKAADRLSKAYKAATGDADLAHWQVRSLLDGGQPVDALAAAEQALAAVQSPVLLLDKADAMYAIDAKRPQSVAAYADAASATEGELAAEALHLAAATALEVGDFAAAKKYAQAVMKTHAGSTFAIDAKVTLAEAQLQSGEADEAASSFASLLDEANDRQRGDWSVRLAWAQSTAGKEAAVVETLRPIVESLEGTNAEQGDFLLGRAHFRTGDPAAAATALEAVANQSPPGAWTPEARLIRARAQAATGATEAAIQGLAELLNTNPTPQLAAQAHYRRAEFHQQAGNANAALADYGKVSTTWPDHPLAPYADYRAATIAMKQNDFEAAAEGFEQLVTKHPDHALFNEAQLALATCLERAGKMQEALAVLDTMQADDPRVALARGAGLAGMKKWDEAIAALSAATQASGEFADRDRAWYELAWAYREADKPEASRKAFAQLVRELPESRLAADAQFRIGESYYDSEQYTEAAKRFALAAGNAQVGEKASHLQGWAFHKAGDHAAAAAAFEQQLADHPRGDLAADAKWMIGEAQFADKNLTAALAAYDAAAHAKPTAETLAPLGMLHAGQAAAALDSWQVAATWLQRVVNEYPEYDGRSEVDYELAWAMTKLGKANEALPLLAKVADRDTSPVGARARFVMGELQFANKQYEDAVRSFFKVAYGYGDRQAPDDYHAWQAESLFEAARCLEQLNRTDAAKKLYAELVERFPTQPKADLANKRLADLP